MYVSEHHEPVVAKIEHKNTLGTSEWYEVIYHNGTEWCSYYTSSTFEDGEQVISWRYCKAIFKEKK